MFKEVFNIESVSLLTQISLVMFAAIFGTVLIWTIARSRRDVSRWANIPLEDGSDSKGNE